MDYCALPPFISDPQQLTLQTYRQIFHRIERMALSSVDWTGLPEGVQQMMIERQLFYTGASVFFYDEILERYLTLPISAQYAWDENGLPVEYEVHGWKDYRRRLNIENSVIIYNDLVMTPSSYMAQIFASRLTDSLRTCDVHLDKQKIGKIISAPEIKAKGIRKVIEKIKSFELYQIVAPPTANAFKEASALDTEPNNCILGDLSNYYQFLWHDCLAYFGLQSISDKKSGINNQESMADATLAIVDKTAVTGPRQLACDKINEMFGLDVWCDFVEPEVPLTGGDDFGKLYNDAQDSDGRTDRENETS